MRAPSAKPNRDVAVDVVRGCAVLLMVLDHVLVQVDPASTLRVGAPWSITRLSLPLFMLACAAVYRRSTSTRWRLTWVACAEMVLYELLEMPAPGIVLLIVILLTFLDLFREPPYYWLGVVGLVQALYVPVPWDGYQPGLVLAWFCLARLATTAGTFVPAGTADRGMLVPALAWVGRHPLWWYLGHLVALAIVFVVGGEFGR